MTFVNEKCSMITGILLTLALLAGCLPGQVERPASTATTVGPSTAVPPSPTLAPLSQRDANGHYFKGNPNAKVVLEDWSDLQ